MLQITVQIDGMMCGMCEAHVNDAIRRHFNVKKVQSSHKKGRTVILTENGIPSGRISEVISETGYKVLSVDEKEYVKKGLLSFLHL